LPRTPSRTRPKPQQPPQPSHKGEREIVEGIRSSSEEDFNLLYERYFQRVYSFAYLRLRNRADTEEVVQETFTVVFRSIDAYRGQSSLLSWIYGIAKNTVNNHVRRARAYEARIERAEVELQRGSHSLATCTPEENLSLQRCAEAVHDRLASVADWHAEVFLLRHVENLPINEIARRMSRSNDAVRSSLYRVKRLLVEAIDPALLQAS
jgi:RNA polymerase sigma-70 factor (ECF subfamily)